MWMKPDLWAWELSKTVHFQIKQLIMFNNVSVTETDWAAKRSGLWTSGKKIQVLQQL